MSCIAAIVDSIHVHTWKKIHTYYISVATYILLLLLNVGLLMPPSEESYRESTDRSVLDIQLHST